MIDPTITIIIHDHTQPTICDITNITAQAGINIDSLDAEALDTKGVIHLTVCEKFHTLAVDLLRDKGYTVLAQNHQLYEVDDKPGALAQLAQKLKDQNLSIQSLRFLKKDQGKALVSIAFYEAHHI